MKKLKLNKRLYTKWLSNQKTFLAPLGVLYLAFVINKVSDGFSFNDFVPSNEVITALVLYLLNSAYDYLRKLAGK